MTFFPPAFGLTKPSAETSARDLLQRTRDLASDISFERSVQLGPGAANWHRFLLAVDANTLSREDMMQAGRDLGLPEELLNQLKEAPKDPNTLLLGFEGKDTHHIYKLYLEYWDSMLAQIKSSGVLATPRLLNLGFKWDPQRPEHHAVTRYLCHPGLNLNQIMDRLTRITPAGSPAHDAGMAIIRKVGHRLAAPSLTYLEATEDNGRLSYDLNIYPAALQMADLRELLADLADRMDIASATMAPIDDCLAMTVGHISAGTGRDGQAFFTVYFEDKLPPILDP